MLTDQPDVTVLAQFIHTLPDAAVYLEAVRDGQRQLTDLRIAQANGKGHRLVAQGVFDADTGERLLGDDSNRRRLLQPVFGQYAAVLLTGEPQTFDVLNPVTNQLLHITRSRLGDGVLVVVRDRVGPAHPAEPDALTGILDASLNGILTGEPIRNADGRITDFRLMRLNSAARRMLSLPDDVLGKPMLDSLPGARAVGLLDAFRRVIETGRPERFETSFPAGDGPFWYDMLAAKLGDGLVLTFNDITQNKRATLELERQKRLLNGVVNNVQIGLLLLEPVRSVAGEIVDLRYTLTNEKAAEILGRTVADMTGRTLLETYPGSDTFELPGGERGESMLSRYIRQIREGGTSGYEFNYDRDGLDIWFQTTANVLPDREGIVISFADITRIKQSQQALERAAAENQQQAQFLHNVLDSSSNGIVAERSVRDATGRIVDFRIVSANRQAAEIVHSTVDDLVGRNDLELHPSLRESGLFDAYVKTVETGEPQVVETHYNDGRLDHWVKVTTRKLGDGQVVTFDDVSETKRLQQALERAIAESKQQAGLMQAMLNGAINGVVLLEPVRDAGAENAAGPVIDFRIRGGNPAVRELTGVDANAAVGQPMSQAYPAYRETGFFDLYRRTLEAGEPQREEYFYKDEHLEGWFDVSAVPQRFDDGRDGIVVTFASTTDARQAQQAVEEAAATLQAVIDNSQTGIFVFSPVYDRAGKLVDFRFKTINRMVAALVGQTPDVLTGAVASDWFISYRETGLFDRYRHTFETGDEQHFDIHYNVDGFDVWFDVHAVKFGPNVLVTFTNYTDLKRAQLAVEQQAALLNSVLDSSISGIIAFEALRDAAGRIVDFRFVTANKACEKLLRLPPETMRGNKLLTLFPGNVETGLFDLYKRTTETGEPGRSEVYYNLDGLDFWLDISAEKLGDGFVVTFTDISEVKRAQQTVERTAANLQAVIDNSQTAIFLLAPAYDDSGQIVDFTYRALNQTLANYVRQTPAVMLGTPVSRWFPTHKRGGYNFRRYCEVFKTGQPQRYEVHYDSDGIEAWLDVSVSCVDSEILVTFLDYTPLKKLQQQLEASVVDLQRSNANLEQFAYVASHDLQEPLRKIQAFGDIIQTQYAPVIGEEGADMIRRMQAAAARMQVLIKDVLTYSRVATKREAAQPVALGRLVGEVVDDLETAISARHATVEIGPLPTVTGDAPQLRQLFQNLISNALKFAKSAGTEPPTVGITARTLPGRDTGVNVPPGDANRLFHQIDVTDNGIGFDPHQADRIFQVFQRLHGRNEYPGTGIGLAIVKKVIENHHGYIQAVGQPGVGATFRVLLPAEES